VSGDLARRAAIAFDLTPGMQVIDPDGVTWRLVGIDGAVCGVSDDGEIRPVADLQASARLDLDDATGATKGAMLAQVREIWPLFTVAPMFEKIVRTGQFVRSTFGAWGATTYADPGEMCVHPASSEEDAMVRAMELHRNRP
jgi:hypothetical protein